MAGAKLVIAPEISKSTEILPRILKYRTASFSRSPFVERSD